MSYHEIFGQADAVLLAKLIASMTSCHVDLTVRIVTEDGHDLFNAVA